ncbi:AAA family ATPase [Spirochaeta dissipatitropha]
MTLHDAHELCGKIRQAISFCFIGSPSTVDLVITGLVSGLHVLIEDVPGVGKTTLSKGLAQITGMDFGRIQLTPDVLPGDITGMNIYDPHKQDFVFRKGAIEHQFVLADELNRASERTQSALLEAMQEEQITVDDQTRPIPQPFFLIATQNPSHFAGTFRLPESQLERFGISASIGYPTEQQEMEILELTAESVRPEQAPVLLDPQKLMELRRICSGIFVSQEVRQYITALAAASRRSRQLDSGVSPRTSGHLLRAARASAMLAGRDHTAPEDVRKMLPAVYAHKLNISGEARISGENIQEVLETLLERVPVPAGT